MRKVLVTTLFLVCILIAILYLKEKSYSPLSENKFQSLFPKYEGGSRKVCGIDFLGLSFHNELFELYLYKTDCVYIDTNYPQFVDEWEDKEITGNVTTSKWKSCPIDTVTMTLYEFTLTANNFNEKECSKSFNKALLNPENYYSYVYFNELEEYFLLFCPDKQELFYIRRKGF